MIRLLFLRGPTDRVKVREEEEEGRKLGKSLQEDDWMILDEQIKRILSPLMGVKAQVWANKSQKRVSNIHILLDNSTTDVPRKVRKTIHKYSILN